MHNRWSFQTAYEYSVKQQARIECLIYNKQIVSETVNISIKLKTGWLEFCPKFSFTLFHTQKKLVEERRGLSQPLHC